MSEAKKGGGGRQIAAKCINIAAAQHHLGPSACQCLPAVHAFGGCDTTSAIFGHCKGSYTHLNSSAQLQHYCITLQTEAATQAPSSELPDMLWDEELDYIYEEDV